MLVQYSVLDKTIDIRMYVRPATHYYCDGVSESVSFNILISSHVCSHQFIQKW